VSRKTLSCEAMRTASAGAAGPRAMISERFSPCTYSIAMK
jgi:hypothetical protein